MAELRDVLAAALFAADDEISYANAWGMLFEHGQTEHDGDCTKKAFTCPLCLADIQCESADRFSAALAEAGFAVVPRVPTEAMDLAGSEMQWDVNTGHNDVWDAMLSAAPTPGERP